jgi:hypothetical protein
MGVLTTVVDTGAAVAGFGDGAGDGWQATSVQEQGAFDLNSRLINFCRIGDGVQLTHEDWLPGVQVWQPLLQGHGQLQLVFGEPASQADGSRRGCAAALVVVVVAGLLVVGLLPYWITGVLIGVRAGCLSGTEGFG